MTVSTVTYGRQGRVQLHPDEADDIDIDDDNEGHLARHGITATEVAQVWLSAPVYAPNKKGLAATWLMLGDTAGGRALTVPVTVDPIRSLLRPVTGWDSTPGELTRWRPGAR